MSDEYGTALVFKDKQDIKEVVEHLQGLMEAKEEGVSEKGWPAVYALIPSGCDKKIAEQWINDIWFMAKAVQMQRSVKLKKGAKSR